MMLISDKYHVTFLNFQTGDSGPYRRAKYAPPYLPSAGTPEPLYPCALQFRFNNHQWIGLRYEILLAGCTISVVAARILIPPHPRPISVGSDTKWANSAEPCVAKTLTSEWGGGRREGSTVGAMVDFASPRGHLGSARAINGAAAAAGK